MHITQFSIMVHLWCWHNNWTY